MVPFWKLWSGNSNEWMDDIKPGDKTFIVIFGRILFFIMFIVFCITSCTVIDGVYGKQDIHIEQPGSAQDMLIKQIQALDRSYLTTEQTAELMEKLIDKYDPVIEMFGPKINRLPEDEVKRRLEEQGADKATTTKILEAMRGE